MDDLFREIGNIKQMQVDSKRSDETINKKLDNIQETLQPIQEDVARHSREIKSLNHDKRRKNLVIFGLPQEAEESVEQLEEKIMHLFIHTMGVTTFTLMELDFVKRTKSEKMPKPVVLGFTTQRRKISILKNRGKLRGSRIYTHEDSTPEIRAQEKALRTQMYELRREASMQSLELES
ncbi:hypothetical protein WDU94_000562 [Cyamophila willieti]